ncbi:hypothetical protein GWK41_05290 [Persephonella atlantica]|uniref:Flagellar hook-length control protein-like C-terminal domain-containing protein n=1 Tax=Persephonella atlantica TaxID=2699429 RepID=A0ABS1GHZ8_9AQUI|nr:hypothetical protein [Persephonella atlantica]MBK3332475.1 hypothetical protein [Persephonella atlantica]
MNVAKVLFTGELTNKKLKTKKDKSGLFTDLFDTLYKEIVKRDKSLKGKTSTSLFTDLKFETSSILPDKAINQTKPKSVSATPDRTVRTEKSLRQTDSNTTFIFNKSSFDKTQSNLIPWSLSSKKGHSQNFPIKSAKSNKMTSLLHLNVEFPAISWSNPYPTDITFLSGQHLKKGFLPKAPLDSFLQTKKQQKTKKTDISPDNVQSLSKKSLTHTGEIIKSEISKIFKKTNHHKFSDEGSSTKNTVNLSVAQTPLQGSFKPVHSAQLKENKLILKNNPANSLPENIKDTHISKHLQKEILLKEKAAQTDIPEKNHSFDGKDKRTDSLDKAVNNVDIQKEQIKQTDISKHVLNLNKNFSVNRIIEEGQLKNSLHQKKVVDISEHKNSPVSVIQKNEIPLKGEPVLETERKVKKTLHKREKILKKFTESPKTDFFYSKTRSEERENNLDVDTDMDKRPLTGNIHLFNLQTEKKQNSRILLDSHKAVEIPVKDDSYQSWGDGNTEGSSQYSTPEQQFDTADIKQTNKTVDFSVKIGDIGFKARYNGYKLNLIIMTDHQHAQMINSIKSEIVHIIEESGIQSYILRIKSKEKSYKISSGSDTPHKTVRSREINVRV